MHLDPGGGQDLPNIKNACHSSEGWNLILIILIFGKSESWNLILIILIFCSTRGHAFKNFSEILILKKISVFDFKFSFSRTPIIKIILLSGLMLLRMRLI